MPSTRNVWETTLKQDLRTEFQFLFMLMFTEAEVNKRVLFIFGGAKSLLLCGFSLAVVHELLITVASLIAEHGL